MVMVKKQLEQYHYIKMAECRPHLHAAVLGLADARQTTTEHTNSPHTQQFLVKHFREILNRNAFVVKRNN